MKLLKVKKVILNRIRDALLEELCNQCTLDTLILLRGNYNYINPIYLVTTQLRSL